MVEDPVTDGESQPSSWRDDAAHPVGQPEDNGEDGERDAKAPQKLLVLVLVAFRLCVSDSFAQQPVVVARKLTLGDLARLGC